MSTTKIVVGSSISVVVPTIRILVGVVSFDDFEDFAAFEVFSALHILFRPLLLFEVPLNDGKKIR
jgi:hypothetical protein